jgi:hypothetical protein
MIKNMEYFLVPILSLHFGVSLLQLAALINDSAGVIATNTAAIQLANTREKPR